MSRSIHLHRNLFISLCVWLLLLSALYAAPTELLPPGFRPVPPGVHALVGGSVVVKPGQTLTNATIIIREGVIQAVATNAAVPADARVWDMTGLTIYAGFIDPYLSLGSKAEGKSKKTEPEVDLTAGGIKFYGVSPQTSGAGDVTGPVYEVAMVSPERRAAQTYQPDFKVLEKLRELGFTDGNIITEKGIFRGTSAFVALSGIPMPTAPSSSRMFFNWSRTIWIINTPMFIPSP